MFLIKKSSLTGEEIYRAEFFNEEKILTQIKNLHISFFSWKTKSISERLNCLKIAYSQFCQYEDELVMLMTQETGKPITQSEVEIKKCKKAFSDILNWDFSFLQSETIQSIYTKSDIVYEPMGVVFSVMPWNFPIWQALRMILPTLISGNTVLLKHSEESPQMGLYLEKIFQNIFQTGPVLVNILAIPEQTELILSQKEVAGVSLTGSTRVGKIVNQLASKYFKKSVMELGGSDPYVVFESADLNLAAKKIATARLNNSGQVCIAAKRCLVQEDVLDKFVDLLKTEFDSYVVGDPFDKKTQVGPLAALRFKLSLDNQKKEMLEQTKSKRIYIKSVADLMLKFPKSAFVDLEIYLCSADEKSLSWFRNQEFFAPVLVIFPFKTESQAVEIANSTDFGLGAAVFTSQELQADRVLQAISAGQVVVNDLVKSDIYLPFGGTKNSGFGRELGRQGFFEFVQTKVYSRS